MKRVLKFVLEAMKATSSAITIVKFIVSMF